jgi:hypothetical protein
MGAETGQPTLKRAQDPNKESLGQKVIEGVPRRCKASDDHVPGRFDRQPAADHGAVGTMVLAGSRDPDDDRHSDPRSGETTYTLSNVTRGEPAANLFDVPQDYTIQDSSYKRSPAVR